MTQIKKSTIMGQMDIDLQFKDLIKKDQFIVEKMNISMLNPEFFYEYLNKVCILQDRQSRMIFFYLTGLQINQKEKMIFQLVVISTMIYSGRITIKLMKNNERNILNIFESAFFQQQDIFLCYFV